MVVTNCRIEHDDRSPRRPSLPWPQIAASHQWSAFTTRQRRRESLHHPIDPAGGWRTRYDSRANPRSRKISHVDLTIIRKISVVSPRPRSLTPAGHLFSLGGDGAQRGSFTGPAARRTSYADYISPRWHASCSGSCGRVATTVCMYSVYARYERVVPLAFVALTIQQPPTSTRSCRHYYAAASQLSKLSFRKRKSTALSDRTPDPWTYTYNTITSTQSASPT
jgi:hypothetical protein